MKFQKGHCNDQLMSPKILHIKEGNQIVLRKVEGGTYLMSDDDDHALQSILMVDPVVSYND